MHTVTREIGGRTISIETGRLAKQADGSVVVRSGDTMVLVTVVADTRPSDRDYFPLFVEYREKFYSSGRIPGGFFKRAILVHEYRCANTGGTELVHLFVQGLAFTMGGNLDHVEVLTTTA